MVTTNNMRKGLLVIISGPSGVGKGTICHALLAKHTDLAYSISATTRKPRMGEVQGKDYYFYTQEEFQKLIKANALLEWAKVYDNYYGTPAAFVDKILNQGNDCILEIDIQGALQVKAKRPEGIFVFIAPPSKEELVRRITCRGTENSEEIARRMGQVDDEMRHLPDYQFMVVNDSVDEAVSKVRSIIVAERCRIC